MGPAVHLGGTNEVELEGRQFFPQSGGSGLNASLECNITLGVHGAC